LAFHKAPPMMTVVCLAGISVASFIGGGLSHPYERFPGVFGWSKFWKDYPFALPCFVSGLFCVTAFTAAFIWLKEVRLWKFDFSDCNQSRYLQTLNHKRRHEVTGRYGPSTDTDSTIDDANSTAATPLLPNSLPPPPPPVREVLTPRVRIAILNNGAISLVRSYLC
jgi:hypothetical protein